MQVKSLVLTAALAISASADIISPVGGALKGLSVAHNNNNNNNKRDDLVAAGNGALKGLFVANNNHKRDEPFAVEWTPGSDLLQEVQEGPASPAAPASTPPAAAPAASPPAASPPVQAHNEAPSPAAPAPAPTTPAAKAQPTPAPAPAAPKLSSPAVSVPPAVTSPPQIGGGQVGGGTKGPLTFNIVNKMGGSISISYQLGTYSPPTGGATTVAPQLLGVTETTGTFAQSTQVVAPVGWAGRMTIGKSGAPLDFRGTKIEGNNGFDGADPNADPDPDVDVSYVDGYSVPATCSCGDTVLSGCNKDLFSLGIKCDNLVGDSEHPICVNDPRNIHGPASPFFAPCANAAYTYDYNDVANWQGTCKGNVINCCIGTDCAAPTRQLAGNSKREVMALIGARKRSAAALA